MEAPIADKFFGFVLDKLYLEIYALGYNEYLKAVTVLKETLLGEFPERKMEVERSCSEMLIKYSEDFEEIWFKKFTSYCNNNLFMVPPQVPAYDPELEKVEDNKEGHEMYANLHHSILASGYFNSQLMERLKHLEDEIEKREVLLAKVANTEKLLEVLKQSDALEQRISAMVVPQLREHELET